jgi:PAS domain S-box-containing protein
MTLKTARRVLVADPQSTIGNLPRVWVLLAGTYAIAGGAVTLVGWWLELRRLTDWNGDGISMFPNTAACAMLGGVALLSLMAFGRRWAIIVTRAAAAFIALVGALTLFEHLSGVNLGIDTILFDRPWGQLAAAAPMRIGPPASTSFLILGAALFLATYGPRARRVASGLAMLAVAIASLSLTGYLLGADQLFGIAQFTGIAWQTSTIVAALGIGLMAAIAEHGLVAAMKRPDAGGTVLRRLIVPVVVFPLVMGWLRVLGQHAGLYDLEFGTALRTLIEIGLFVAFLWWTANSISRHSSAAAQAEHAMRESEQRFKTLTSRAPVGIFQTDENGNCIFVNERWCEMAGMNAAQARGQGWANALHPEDRERVYREWYDATTRGVEFASEYRFQTPDGRVTWLSGSGITLRGDTGQITGYMGTMTDITQRKLAEQSLMAADRRKDEFLATLAHELRNPLAPIRNSLEILKLAPRDEELLQNTREVMERQLSHLVRLVDDLLDVSRITRDRLELRKQRLELASVIYQAIEACRPMIESLGQELTVSVPQEPIYIDADPVRLAQVFGNLIHNAGKYTGRNGHICVSAAREGHEAVVKVIDDGVGIPPEKLLHVFEMFAQVDRSLEQSHGGLGIGLTLAKRLVEMHGGSVQAYSDGPGQGSEFVVRLPVVAETSATVGSAPVASLAEGGTHRALVVDDNVDAAKSLALLLKLSGNETRTAYDGLKAIEVAESFMPDVILLDIGMPKLNGYDVCRMIRQRPWGKRVNIVALTGWGQDEDRRRSFEAGFDAHLVKPVDPAALSKLLSELPSESNIKSVSQPVHAPPDASHASTHVSRSGTH